MSIGRGRTARAEVGMRDQMCKRPGNYTPALCASSSMRRWSKTPQRKVRHMPAAQGLCEGLSVRAVTPSARTASYLCLHGNGFSSSVRRIPSHTGGKE